MHLGYNPSPTFLTTPDPKSKAQESPHGPVVNTLPFHHRGCRFDQGTKIPPAPRHRQKKKKRRKFLKTKNKKQSPNMGRGLGDYHFSSHRPKMFTNVNKQHTNRIKGLAWDKPQPRWSPFQPENRNRCPRGILLRSSA